MRSDWQHSKNQGINGNEILSLGRKSEVVVVVDNSLSLPEAVQIEVGDSEEALEVGEVRQVEEGAETETSRKGVSNHLA